MDIRDEIDAMLDNLKSSGHTAAPKAAPKKPAAAPAPRKSVYDNMSVDDILTALSDGSKKLSPKTSKPIEKPATPVTVKAPETKSVKPPVRPAEPVKKAFVRAQAHSSSADSAIPESLLSMLSGTAQSAPKETPTATRKSAVAKIKSAIENAPDETAEEAPVFAVPSEPEEIILPAEEEAGEPVLTEALQTEEVTSESDAEDEGTDSDSSSEKDNDDVFYNSEDEADCADENDTAENAEEETEPPKKEKKGFFSGLKSLFSRKNSAASTDDSEENQTDESEEIAAEDCFEDETQEEVSAEDSFEEYVQDEVAETDAEEAIGVDFDDTDEENAKAPDILSESETIVSETFSESTSDEEAGTDEESSLESAAELIDAALAAIEELNLDSTEEFSETKDTEVSDNSVEESQSEADSAEENSADELIADIREDAANAIAKLDKEASDADEEEKAEEALTEEASTTEAESPSDNSEDSASDELSDDINIDVSVGAPRKKGRITAALEKILEENPDVISDERSEKTEEDSLDVSIEKKGSGKLKRNLYAAFGVIMTVLAVFGLVSAVKLALGQFRSFTAGENKKDSFAEVIYPAVIMDIESFAAPSELSSEQVISAALWSLIMSDEDMAKYETTFDIISVPAIDVEAYAAELFGEQLPKINHATVGSGELKFYYNSESKSYNVPVNPITFTYEPIINSVSKNENEYVLIVDYIKELPAWMEEKENFTPEVSKTVEFRLHENEGSYIISSMTVLNVNAVA